MLWTIKKETCLGMLSNTAHICFVSFVYIVVFFIIIVVVVVAVVF